MLLKGLTCLDLSVGKNPKGTKLNWEFVSANFADIAKRFGDSGVESFGMKNIIRSSFENFGSLSDLKGVSTSSPLDHLCCLVPYFVPIAVEEFYQQKPVSTHSMTIVQAIESVELRAAFLKAMGVKFRAALLNL